MQEEDKYWILISRYLANELSDTETDELLAWVKEKPEHTELLQQIQDAWEQSNNYLNTQTSEIDIDKAWLKVEGKLFETRKKSAKIRTIRYWTSIAAAVLLIAGLGWLSVNYYQKNSTIVFANNLDVKQQVLLPDGSRIWLKSGSQISYKKGLNDLDLREVDLKGEGFFEVKHDVKKPFIIHSGGTETQVLGTSFNVTEENGSVKVSVITGKVSFKKENTSNVLFLLPGEEGVYSKAGNISKTNFKNTNFLYWKNSALSFENEQLSAVLAQVEEVYKVNFKISDKELLNKKITTSFQSASVYQIINVLETLLDVKIEKSNDAYIVVK